MKNHTKERILGSTILLGGGILLSAMLYRTGDVSVNQSTANQSTANQSMVGENTVVVTDEQVAENTRPTLDVMTADYDTEQRILAEKREQRAAQIEERRAQIDALLKTQTEARAKALEKAAKEQSAGDSVTLTPAGSSSIQKTKDLIDEVEAEAAKLKKLQAEKAALEAAQKADDAKLKATIAAQEKQRQAQKKQLSYGEAKKKLREARKEADSSAGRFGVQVALAANEAAADDLAQRLKKYGYKVSTSKTNRGVRVVVGPERGRNTAYALREKLQADQRFSISGAWVTAYNPPAEKQLAKKQAAKKEAAESPQKPVADKYRYGVQVAMAGDTASRDALVAKLKKHGYKVTTSDTSRGTRIIVGGGMKKEAAQKLQAKVNADSRIGISGAWLKREPRR